MSTLRPKINLFILGLFLLLTIAGCAPNDKNFDFWGIDRPRFERYTLSEDKVRIDGPKEQYWEIIYEQKKDSVFTGLVRHVNTDYDPYFPILTHDILVTTGDFADPDRVNTRVFDHHFYWVATDENEPQGTINLLHIVTIDPVVYDQLMNIHPDDMISVTGREILEIRHITSKGVWDRTWRDAGCNTLLVTEVNIEDVSTP